MGREGTLAAAPVQSATALGGTPLAYRIAHVVAVSVLRLVFRFDITGRVNIPADKPYIVIANHLNWLDSFALLIALPRTPRVCFIGWSNILNSRRLSLVIRLTRFGLIPIERDPVQRGRTRRETLHVLEQCIRLGHPIVLFPEGHVGCEEGKLAQLHSGFARLASVSGAPIVPVALSGTRRLWLRKRIKVVIGTPVSPRGETIDGLRAQARDAIHGLMPPPPIGHDRIRLFERKLTRLIPSLTNWGPTDL